MREHIITLNTHECAAFLAAAKQVLDAYDNQPERKGEPSETLQSAVHKMAAGMGLSSERAADLLQFMSTGRPSGTWNNIFS